MPDITRFDEPQWTRQKPDCNRNTTYSPHLQHQDFFTPHQLSYPGVAQRVGYWGERYWGDCCHLPSNQAAVDPHPHPRCIRLPQYRAELALPGMVFTTPPHLHPPSHRWHESPDCVVVGKSTCSVGTGQAAEVVGMGYDHASPAVPRVSCFANRQPTSLHLQLKY